MKRKDKYTSTDKNESGGIDWHFTGAAVAWGLIAVVMGLAWLGWQSLAAPAPAATVTPLRMATATAPAGAGSSSNSITINQVQQQPPAAPTAPPATAAPMPTADSETQSIARYAATVAAGNATRIAELETDGGNTQAIAGSVATIAAGNATRIAGLETADRTALSAADGAADVADMAVGVGVLSMFAVAAVALAGWWSMSAQNRFERAKPVQNQLEPAGTGPHRLEPPSKPVRTGLNGAEPFRNGAVKPPELPPELDINQVTAADRAVVRYWHERLGGSLSATARALFGYKNQRTFDAVKSAVEEVTQHD